MKINTERDNQIFTRYMALGEFYTKRERYCDIAAEHEISWLRVRDIVLKRMKAERRAK